MLKSEVLDNLEFFLGLGSVLFSGNQNMVMPVLWLSSWNSVVLVFAYVMFIANEFAYGLYPS